MNTINTTIVQVIAGILAAMTLLQSCASDRQKGTARYVFNAVFYALLAAAFLGVAVYLAVA